MTNDARRFSKLEIGLLLMLTQRILKAMIVQKKFQG